MQDSREEAQPKMKKHVYLNTALALIAIILSTVALVDPCHVEPVQEAE